MNFLQGRIFENRLCQQPHSGQRLFHAPRLLVQMALVVYPPSPPFPGRRRELPVKGAERAANGGLPFPAARRGYILQSRPLSHEWERAGG